VTRIILPYTEICPETLASLEGPVEQVDVSADNEAYYRLLADLWHSGDDFVIVEHDMVVPPGALGRLQTCPQEWCGVPYWLYGGWGVWHGVTRYRGSLTQRHPLLPESIQNRDWKALDSAVINHLRLLGYPEAHWHWPPAGHLKPKHLPGMGVWTFVQCPGCGSALDPEDIQTDPRVVCRECGAVSFTPVPERTATDSVL
jgi:hypothetical protein